MTRAQLERRLMNAQADTPRRMLAALDAIRDATPDGPAQLAEALGLAGEEYELPRNPDGKRAWGIRIRPREGATHMSKLTPEQRAADRALLGQIPTLLRGDARPEAWAIIHRAAEGWPAALDALDEAEAVVRYEQERNANNVAMADADIAHLRELLRAAEEAVEFIRDKWSPVGAHACPACVYEAGVFKRPCNEYAAGLAEKLRVAEAENVELRDVLDQARVGFAFADRRVKVAQEREAHADAHIARDADTARKAALLAEENMRLARNANLAREEVEPLRAEVARLREVLTDVMAWGVEHDDPRIAYLTVQVDRESATAARAALAATPDSKEKP